MIDLSGKTALITGGARGLGRAIGLAMERGGAAIHVADLPEILDEGLPKGWGALPVDLTRADASALMSEYMAGLGGLDILVANAGAVPPWRRIEALDFNEWDRVFALNVRGVAVSLKSAAPYLAVVKGAVVVMASLNGYRAHPDQALYTASKHAVLGLARAAALDMGRDGVRVNALAPGPILTEALQSRIETRAAQGGTPAADAIAAMQGETALGVLATEADVAHAACFLASPIAAGITGICMPVEAGLP